MSYEHLPEQPTDFIGQMMSVFGDPVNYEPDWELVDAVRACVDMLEGEHKMLVELLVYDKYSYNEITEVMGYSSKSVAWYQMRKALDQLKVLLLENPTLKERYYD